MTIPPIPPIPARLSSREILDIAEWAWSGLPVSKVDLLGQSYLELDAESRRVIDAQRTAIDVLHRTVTQLQAELTEAKAAAARHAFSFSCAAELIADLEKQLGHSSEDRTEMALEHLRQAGAL